MMKKRGLLGLKTVKKEELISIFREIQEVEQKLETASYSNIRYCGSRVGAIFMEKRERLREVLKWGALTLSVEFIAVGGDSKKSFRENLAHMDTLTGEKGIKGLVVSHNQSGAAVYADKVTDYTIFNGGDGYGEDPFPALLDLFSIWKEKGTFEDVTVLLVGDMLHSRVGRSLLFSLQELGAEVRIVGPATLVPEEFTDMGARIYKKMEEALSGVHVVRLLPFTVPLDELVKQGFLPHAREYDLFFSLGERKGSLLQDRVMIIEDESKETGPALQELALAIIVLETILAGGENHETFN